MLDAIIAHVLAKAPGDRYASVGELLQDIEQAAASASIALSHGEVARYLRANKEALDTLAAGLVGGGGDLERSFTSEHPGTVEQPIPPQMQQKRSRMPLVAGALALIAAGSVAAVFLNRAAPVVVIDAAPVEALDKPTPAQPASVEAPVVAVVAEHKPVSTPSKGKRKNAPVVTVAVGTGKLRVVSKPSGAEVSVDGRRVGETPFAPIELRPGSHSVVVEHADLQKREARRVEISADKETLLKVDLSR